MVDLFSLALRHDIGPRPRYVSYAPLRFRGRRWAIATVTGPALTRNPGYRLLSPQLDTQITERNAGGRLCTVANASLHQN